MTIVILAFFYKQLLYKQSQFEIGKKTKQILSNTLRLNLWYLKIIHILHANITENILKEQVKNKCVSIHEIMRLIIMKMMVKIDHIDKTNRPRSSHGHKYNIVNMKSVSPS